MSTKSGMVECLIHWIRSPESMPADPCPKGIQSCTPRRLHPGDGGFDHDGGLTKCIEFDTVAFRWLDGRPWNALTRRWAEAKKNYGTIGRGQLVAMPPQRHQSEANPLRFRPRHPVDVFGGLSHDLPIEATG